MDPGERANTQRHRKQMRRCMIGRVRGPKFRLMSALRRSRVEDALDHCQFVANGILKLSVTGRGFQHRVHEHAAALQLIANAPLTATSRPNRRDFVSRIQTRTATVV
jgi:hypothetical protein